MRTSKAMTLQSEMERVGQQNKDWFLDEISFASYKDYGVTLHEAATAKENEDLSATAILVSTGDPNQAAVPAEQRSGVLKSLGSQTADGVGRIHRLYYHQKLTEKTVPLLRRL